MTTGKGNHRKKMEIDMGRTGSQIQRSRMRHARGFLVGVSMFGLLAALPIGGQADVDFSSPPQGARTDSQPASGAGGASGQRWAAMSGSTLKDTLETWSRTSGWTIVWDTEMNYQLRASATFAGSFQRSVTALVDSIHVNNPELTVTLYTGNRVVHVQTLLNETR